MPTPPTKHVPLKLLSKCFEWGIVSAFVVGGFCVVAHWRDNDSAALLLVWLPVLFGLATTISKRKQIVDELRATPLWFAVSQPEAYEHPMGYGRTFKFDEELARAHAGQKYTENKVYYFDIDAGLPWPTEHLGFHLGGRRNVLEVKRDQAQLLARKCREYVTATQKCYGYFALGWIGAVVLPFFVTLQQNETLLGVAVWVVVLWGALPRWSMRDRTGDDEFLSPQHTHVYSYYPSDNKHKAFYACLCGRTEIARQPTESE